MPTITEALAELKTIDKRIEKKQQAIMPYLTRQDIVTDPVKIDGGSPAMLAAELQAIGDLMERKVKIRAAIHGANAATSVTVGAETRTMLQWLVWRRDVSKSRADLLRTLFDQINARRNHWDKEIAGLPSKEAREARGNLLINVDEAWVIAEREKLETTLGDLDGQLSLKNATVVISY